jgi:tRNA-splicing ligase RtcB (3'-phosphate/5'-hydroxy nucleic acid ligase)
MNLTDFKKISDFEWEIPRSYRHDMRVPVRVFATRKLLEETLDDLSMEQAVNAATLPGVVGAVCVMPDMHQGYGFPIGGVAATQVPDGVISPGGIGYDINCLTGDARILHEHGYTLPIEQFRDSWKNERLACFSFGEQKRTNTQPQFWFAKKPTTPVFRLATESGQCITATADHPFYTPRGMVALGALSAGDRVALFPYEGVPYEAPQGDWIVREEDFRAFLLTLGKTTQGNALGQIITFLKDRELLPLSYASPKLPLLIKLLGFVFGDGSIHFNKVGQKGHVGFYGKAEDLEDIQQDIARLGFSPSQIWQRSRHQAIQTTYDQYQFDHTERWVNVNSSALAALLIYLGAPNGNKATQEYDLPAWLDTAPAWQKRLFIAALFGAELSSPTAVSGHGMVMAAPVLSMNKRENVVESGEAFLDHLARWLEELGVCTLPIEQRREQVNKDGLRSIRLRLIVQSDPDNLIRLWSQVGFLYNRKRTALAGAAVEYLRLKQRFIAARMAIALKSQQLSAEGMPKKEIFAQLAGPIANERFIQRSLYEGRKTPPRVGEEFPSFAEVTQFITDGLGDSGMVWARIESIQAVEGGELVYDFTVDHPDHNFVANQFVVSNCGVRLLSSSILYDEAERYLDDLATALDHYCPSGVGTKGGLKLTDSELEQVCKLGSRWALKKGLATEQDVRRTEESGQLEGADPRKVSPRARERGRTQLGTLGSGNHFLEVDVVDEIYDTTAAAAMGLSEGTLCLSIHCGSRGFGHQICTDYVQTFQAAVRKYGISLPDRELVCAPLNSPEGVDYLGAMRSAANYAFANRQLLAHQARQAFDSVLAGKVQDWEIRQVYDICHNIGKIETHTVDGQQMKVCVHRKGATRAFGPGSPGLPEEYSAIGQPVLVPGSMGTSSWVLVGTETSMERSFGSSCHGAGRVMSRSQAKRQVRGDELKKDLQSEGIHVRAGSLAGLAEEAPEAYKDVDRVVETVSGAGIARKVARLRPVAVVKG